MEHSSSNSPVERVSSSIFLTMAIEAPKQCNYAARTAKQLCGRRNSVISPRNTSSSPVRPRQLPASSSVKRYWSPRTFATRGRTPQRTCPSRWRANGFFRDDMSGISGTAAPMADLDKCFFSNPDQVFFSQDRGVHRGRGRRRLDECVDAPTQGVAFSKPFRKTVTPVMSTAPMSQRKPCGRGMPR
jgi:hypothetical protein